MQGGLGADPVTVAVFLVLFAVVAGAGWFAARWRRGDLSQLTEWGLGGRRFGTLITWFLLGGDLYTAYTFIAVPALMFGAGATGFFAVPYAHAGLSAAVRGLSAAVVGGAHARLCHRRRFRARPFRHPQRWRWPWRSPASSPPCPISRCNLSACRW